MNAAPAPTRRSFLCTMPKGNRKHNKFGGSRNENRTRDGGKTRRDDGFKEADPIRPREKEVRPRPPPRDPTTPYNGRRASAISAFEFWQLRSIYTSYFGRLAEFRLMQFEIAQWYKITFSNERLAFCATRGIKWKNISGPVISDFEICAKLQAALRLRIFSGNIFGHVTRETVNRLQAMAPADISGDSRFADLNVVVDSPDVDSQLNGANGEVTGTDDHDIMNWVGDIPQRIGDSVIMQPIVHHIQEVRTRKLGRYVAHIFRARDTFTPAIVAAPIERCHCCSSYLTEQLNIVRQCIRELEDVFIAPRTCPDCQPIITVTPDRKTPDSAITRLLEINDPRNTASSSDSLNGQHGEATNTDDVKRNNAKNAGLLGKLAAIESKMASLMLRTKQMKKTRKNATKTVRTTGRKTHAGRRNPRSAVAIGGSAISKLSELHPHTQQFMVAMANPHSKAATGVGSVVNAHTTQKAEARLTFTIETGASNENFIFVTPCTCNSLPSILHWNTGLYTTDTYNGSVAVESSYNSYAFTSLPYDGNSFGRETVATPTNISGRVICVGIRVTAIGAVQDRGGEALWLETPNHSPVAAATTTGNALGTSIESRRGTRRVDLARAHAHEFSVHPHSRRELDFPSGSSNGSFPNSYWYPMGQEGQVFGPGGNANVGNPVAVLWFPGGPVGTYRIECITHVEFTGSRVQPLATPTHSDDTNGMLVTESIKKVKQEHHKDPHKNIMGDVFSNVMKELTAKAVKGGTDMLKKELSNPELAGNAVAFAASLLA